MLFLRFGPGCSTTSGTTDAKSGCLPVGEAFPPLAPLHVARYEPAVGLQHEGPITVSELSGDQLHWHASAKVFHGPMVAAVMEPERGQPERPEAFPVVVRSLPAVSIPRKMRSPGRSVGRWRSTKCQAQSAM